MKRICKNCNHCKPTYKGGLCEVTDKKTKLNKEGCEEWKPKN